MAPHGLIVTAIGTCRVVDPVKAAERARAFKRNATGLYGFVHTAKEVLQQLDFLEGRNIPAVLGRFLASHGRMPARPPRKHADAFIVEISSMREIHFNEFVLQSNYLERVFRDRPDLLQTLHRHPGSDERAAREALLAALPAFGRATPIERRVLMESHIRHTTKEELAADLASIVRRLDRPTLLVGHVNVTDADGKPIERRAKLSAWLAEVCARDGFHFFDPTPHVEAYGKSRALEAHGTDINHYTPQFYAEIGCLLFDAVSALPASELSPPPVKIADKKPAAAVANGAAAAVSSDEPAARRAKDAGRDEAKSISLAARELSRARRYAEAAVEWRRVAALSTARPGPLIEAARNEFRAQNFDAALALAEAALQRDAQSASALLVKCNALERLARAGDLAAAATALAALDPANALEFLPALSAHRPEAAAALVAEVRRHKGNYNISPETTTRLARLLANRAKAAEDNGDAAAALANWKAILWVDPEDQRAQSRLRHALAPLVASARQSVAQGDLEMAARDYRSALALNDGDLRVLREFAKLLEQKGDAAEAVGVWASLARHEPGEFVKYLIKAARSAIAAGNPIEALQVCRALKTAAPAEAAAETVAFVCRRTVPAMREDFDAGRIDDAVRKAQGLRELDPANEAASRILHKAAASYVGILRSEKVKSKPESAIELCRKILAIDPNHAEALRSLARALGDAGEHSERIEICKRLAETEPGNAQNWVRLASACRAGRDYANGAKAALRAIAIEPGHERAMQLLRDMVGNRAELAR